MSNHRDISFRIALANKYMFRKLKPHDLTHEAAVEEEDELEKYSVRKNTIRVLSITVREQTIHFPIIKVRKDIKKDKAIDGIVLAKD